MAFLPVSILDSEAKPPPSECPTKVNSLLFEILTALKAASIY